MSKPDEARNGGRIGPEHFPHLYEINDRARLLRDEAASRGETLEWQEALKRASLERGKVKQGEAVTRDEAKGAIVLLLRYLGENPERPELLGTPDRMLDAYEELYGGYGQDPKAELEKEFEAAPTYKGMVLVKDIQFFSHCEHHMMLMQGRAHVAYIADKHVAGLSKLARVVAVLSRRLQSQERLTAEIADALEGSLKPLGIAVVIEAGHACMSTRGVRQGESETYTAEYRGRFLSEEALRVELQSRLRLG